MVDTDPFVNYLNFIVPGREYLNQLVAIPKMLESLVVSIINRTMGRYIDDIQQDQISIGIWKGDLSLNNVKVKKSAMDLLNLPVKITEGILGTLEVKIPWKSLKSSPVKICIKQLMVSLAPVELSFQVKNDQ
jgi:vacuolar protein sorting-associated protein 13A/C